MTGKVRSTQISINTEGEIYFALPFGMEQACVRCCGALSRTRFVNCGVTRKPLTYCWPCAMRHTSRSKFLLLATPKLKWFIMALRTRGCILASPWVCASMASFLAMFWRRKLSRSISSRVIG